MFTLVGLIVVSLLCLHLLGGPSIIHPMRMIAHGRHLMNDDSCSHLDQQIKYLETLVKLNERKHVDTLERLRAQNADTRNKLDVQRELVKELERRNRQLMDKMSNIDTGRPRKKKEEYRLAPQIKPDTLRTLNIQQHSEFEVIPYTSFSRDRLYQLDSGMFNKPELPANGDKKQDFDKMMDTALSILNENEDSDQSYQYTAFDLLQGYWRTNKRVGTQYELYFHSKGKRHIYEHIRLFRPFAPIQKVQVQTYDKRNEWINIIVPLSGRVETFKQFMEMFVEQGIKKDQKVFLTLVYFGSDGLQDVKDLLASVSEEHQFTHYKVIERTEEFSRGVGLFAGAEAWNKGNVLLFFCDVDVFFKDGFLDRCRLNTVPATKVYYPIVFSLYNPSIVYGSKKQTPDWREQLVLARESGFWRTFGFGMTCMYRSDFLFMRGFDTKIQGWGFEDVKLYRKLVQSNIGIVRSPDPGIFHLWHEKHCDPHLPPVQYNMCLGSKAIGEASHAQLGMLAFRELKEENERLHETVGESESDPDVNLEQINDMFDNMDTAL